MSSFIDNFKHNKPINSVSKRNSAFLKLSLFLPYTHFLYHSKHLLPVKLPPFNHHIIIHSNPKLYTLYIRIFKVHRKQKCKNSKVQNFMHSRVDYSLASGPKRVLKHSNDSLLSSNQTYTKNPMEKPLNFTKIWKTKEFFMETPACMKMGFYRINQTH